MYTDRGLLTVLLLAGVSLAQEQTPRPLRFAWPSPSHARVTETIPGTGAPTIEFVYELHVDRDEPGAPREVRFSEFRFRRLGSDSLSGVERANLAAMTVPGLVTRPTLRVDDRGRVTGTSGYEAAARAMFAMMPDIAPAMTPDLRTRIENQWLGAEARDLAIGRAQADWEAWVGAWIGFVPKRGEPEPQSIELKHGSVEVPATVTIEVVPDLTLGEHELRLLSRTIAEGADARRAMQRVVDEAERARANETGDQPRERKVVDYRVEDRVEAVVDRRTMRPRLVHVRRARSVTVEGDSASERFEDRRFDFDWLDSGR